MPGLVWRAAHHPSAQACLTGTARAYESTTSNDHALGPERRPRHHVAVDRHAVHGERHLVARPLAADHSPSHRDLWDRNVLKG